MHASTPSGNYATNRSTDSQTKGGDVDQNGDLVDELDSRLASAICAARPSLADDQLRAVKQLIRPWTVTP